MRVRAGLRRAVRVLGQAVVIVLLGAALTEVALRVLHRLSPRFAFPEASYNRARPEPHAESYGFVHNSRGFKDVERQERKPPGVVRILGIGDSFPYGVVPYEHGFLAVLERDLKARHGAVEVVNMGVPGVGLKDYFSLLVNEGLRYDPDLVLLCFYIGNDFRFPFDVPPRSYLLSCLRFLFRVMPEYARQIPLPPAYDDTRPTFSRKAYLKNLRRKIPQFCKVDSELGPNLPKVADYLERIRLTCDRRGIELLVVVIPDELQVDPRLRAEILAEFDDLRPEDYDLAFPNAVLHAELERQGIGYLDLLSVLREESETAPVYKPRDSHWNLRGNRVAAREIGRRLESLVFNRRSG